MESKYLLEDRLSVRTGAVGVIKIPFFKKYFEVITLHRLIGTFCLRHNTCNCLLKPD